MKFQKILEILSVKLQKHLFSTCCHYIQNYFHSPLFTQNEKNGNFMFRFSDVVSSHIHLLKKFIKIKKYKNNKVTIN